MKRLVLIVLIFFFLVTYGYTSDVLRFNNNEYKGLKPGYSTLTEVISKLGQPLKISNRTNYHFKEVIVDFGGRNKKYINTIIINNDFSYTCPNGVKLNEGLRSLLQKLEWLKGGDEWFYDNRQGIFYWHDGQKIIEIVLVYEALRLDEYVIK